MTAAPAPAPLPRSRRWQSLITEDAIRRFRSKVDKSSHPGGCWLWTAGRGNFGYGSFAVTHRLSVGTHAVSYRIDRGEIPPGMWVLHHCDNPQCVNPEHLFLGNASDNMRDAAAKGRCALQQRGLIQRARGQRHSQVKLSPAQVHQIRALFDAAQECHRSIGARFGCTAANVRRIGTRQTWKHLPEVMG